jgi:hypothetical protein
MGEVTVVRRNVPPPEQIRIPKWTKPVEMMEKLSDQARAFLRQRGFSNRFINALGFMLIAAGNVNRRTDWNERHGKVERQPLITPAPNPPSWGEMPSDIRNYVAYSEWHGREIVMPDILAYAPTITYTPTVYRAFASPEGQRFMKRYYMAGWLRRSPEGVWTIAPPAPVSASVPRRRE